MDDQRLGVRFSAEQRLFFHSHICNSSRAHPASYAMDTESCFPGPPNPPGVTRPKHAACHRHPGPKAKEAVAAFTRKQKLIKNCSTHNAHNFSFTPSFMVCAWECLLLFCPPFLYAFKHRAIKFSLRKVLTCIVLWLCGLEFTTTKLCFPHNKTSL